MFIGGKNYVRYQQNETYRTFCRRCSVRNRRCEGISKQGCEEAVHQLLRTTATNIQENAGDILAEAKEINRVRAEEAAKAADPEVEETVEEQVEE